MADLENLKDEILKAAGEQHIVAVVINPVRGQYGYMDEGPPPTAMSWEDASKILDYDYDAGFGGPDCHAFYAWTESRIIYVSEYDGSTQVRWLPRGPAACYPVWA